MNRFLAPLALTAALAACTQGPRPDRLRPTANPSAVIAAELAFAQLAQDKGQWTAFAQTATGDAVMFVPQPIQAQAFLKGRANPAVAVKWQPHQVWSSCDGSIGVTRGAWQGPKASGYFTTVWQRQKNGSYQWVLDQGTDLPMALDAPEMIAAKVAECRPLPPPAVAASAVAAEMAGDRESGTSSDATLKWDTAVATDCSRRFVVQLWNGVDYVDAFTANFDAPESSERPTGGCKQPLAAR